MKIYKKKVKKGLGGVWEMYQDDGLEIKLVEWDFIFHALVIFGLE